MEQVTSFIKKNRNTLIGIGVVVIAVYGYKSWKSKKTMQSGVGSAVNAASGQQNVGQ
jgi:predicted negative regulator of RcsB-dependent stress response